MLNARKIGAMLGAMLKHGTGLIDVVGGYEKAREMMTQQLEMQHTQDSAWLGRLRPKNGMKPAGNPSGHTPHQGPRECARRVRQAQQRALKHSGDWLNA